MNCKTPATMTGRSWAKRRRRAAPSRRARSAIGLLTLVLGLCATLLGTGTAHAAVTLGTWNQLSPATSPDARVFPSMAHNPYSNGLVLFGGSDATNFLNDTWTWDGSTWTKQSPTTSPPARFRASMVFDPDTSQDLLFGGLTYSAVFGDTWSWDGSNWTQLSPANSPSARSLAAMAYDPATKQVILFGGIDNSNLTYLNDTWDWNGSNWVKLSPANSPSPRDGAQLAFDAASNQLILYGGRGGFGTGNSTWSWDGSTWTKLSPATSPPPLAIGSMAYDPSAGGLILFGGSDGSYIHGETWFWDGSSWGQVSTTNAPSARTAAALDFDQNTRHLILFGGALNSTLFGDTWTYIPIVDTTPPTVTISTAASADASTGWYNASSSGTSGIVLNVSATDESGVTALSCTDGANHVLVTPATPNGDGTPGHPYQGTVHLYDGEHSIACSATDGQNNTGAGTGSTAMPVSYQVDQTSPTIVCDTPAPTFVYGQTGAMVSGTVQDVTSGPTESTVSTAVSATTVGSDLSASLTTTDKAGNSAIKSCSYSVTPASQSISFTSTPPSPALVGGNYTTTAKGGDSSNAVVFSIDATSTAGACSISAGTVSFTATGTCVIDANQGGTDAYSAAPQEQQSFTITKASQSISFTSSPPKPALYGGSYTPAARGGGSDNPVTFSIDATGTSGACSISAGKVSFTGPGTCVVDANQTGTDAYGAAPQEQQSFTIDPAALTITAQDGTMTYGGTAPVISPSYEGFVAGDSASSLTNAPTCTANASSTTDAGVYPGRTSCAGAADPNYTISYNTGALTVTPAALTVTADDQTRNYGDPNPPLTVSYSGFVNDQTLETSGVTGAPSCSTTAQPYSPGSVYPITCTRGTLDASNYTFTFFPGTLTVTYSDGSCRTGSHAGPLTVAAGQSVCMGPGFTQTGPIRVDAGGALDVEGATITGPVQATGATTLRMCGTKLTGRLSVASTSGLVVVGDDDGPVCAGNTITGPVQMSGNQGGVEFDNNNVTGPVTISGTTGTTPSPDMSPVDYAGNTVTGPHRISP